MYSLDKVKIGVMVPIEIEIKIKKRAKEKGVSVASYVSAMLHVATYNDPWTEQDEAERQRIYNENLRKREELKAKRRASKGKKEAR